MEPTDPAEPEPIDLTKPIEPAKPLDLSNATSRNEPLGTDGVVQPQIGSAEGMGGIGADVGEFRQGSNLSQWALARYLIGRSIGESISLYLLVYGVIILIGAALLWAFDWKFLGVLVGLVALAVLGTRALLLAILRRLTAARQYGPMEDRLRSLVTDTRKDVLRELRRIGLPGRRWTVPLLAFRLIGRDRRRRTVTQLRTFDVTRAVPGSRLDEVHMLLRSAVARAPREGR